MNVHDMTVNFGFKTGQAMRETVLASIPIPGF